MRLSEAMGLDTGVLTIRLTKFGKSRLVPLHPMTSPALLRQPARRASRATLRRNLLRRRAGRPSATHQYVHRAFWRSPERSGRGAPAIIVGHVCTTSDTASPSGSCSIGIAKRRAAPSGTLYLSRPRLRTRHLLYLSACPELMEEAARRLERGSSTTAIPLPARSSHQLNVRILVSPSQSGPSRNHPLR